MKRQKYSQNQRPQQKSDDLRNRLYFNSTSMMFKDPEKNLNMAMKPKVEKDDKLPRIENKNMNLSYMIPDKELNENKNSSLIRQLSPIAKNKQREQSVVFEKSNSKIQQEEKRYFSIPKHFNSNLIQINRSQLNMSMINPTNLNQNNMNQSLIQQKQMNGSMLNQSMINFSKTNLDPIEQTIDKPQFIHPPLQNQNQVQKIEYKGRNQRKQYTMLEYCQRLLKSQLEKQQFCYMNRKKHAYDYEIVNFRDIDTQKYITVSQRGVTIFFQGEQEYTTLDSWINDVQVFQKITQLHFFSIYKFWKVFRSWVKLTRKNCMSISKKILINQLYILDPILNQAIVKIQNQLEDFQNLPTFDFGINEPTIFNEFIQRQKNFQLTLMTKKIQLREKEILKIVLKACQDSVKDFKTRNRLDNPEESSKTILIGDESKKSMPYTIEATIRDYQKSLFNFVKYIDNLIINAKSILVKQNLAKFCTIIGDFLQLSNRSFTWIIVELTIERGKIEFVPKKATIKEAFQQIYSESIFQISYLMKPLISNSQIQELLNQKMDTSAIIDIEQIVKFDKSVLDQKQKFEQKLLATVAILNRYHSKITPFLNMYLKNKTIQPLDKNINIKQYETLISKYILQDQQLQSLEKITELGIFRIDSQSFNDLIKNCAFNCLQEVYLQLPQILLYNCEQFLVEAQEINIQLNQTINESSQKFVEFFVKHTDYVKNAKQFEKDNSSLILDLSSLMKLIMHRRIKFEDEVRSKYQKSINYLNTIRQKIELALSDHDLNMNKSSKKLFFQIPQINSAIQKLNQEINREYYLDIQFNNDDIMISLLEQQTILQALQVTIDKHQYFSEKLQLDITEFSKIQEITDRFQEIYQLNHSRQEFLNYLKSQQDQQILNINIKDYDNIFKKMTKVISHSLKFLEKNSVITHFQEEVHEFEQMLIILRILKTETLKVTDWIIFRKIISPKIKNADELFYELDDPKYDYKFIEQLNIFEFIPELSEVANHSVREKELSLQVTQIQEFWNSAKITSQPQVGTQDDHILFNNEDIILKIEEHITVLNGILSNKYIVNLEKLVLQEIEQFSNLQILLEEWIDNQNTYLYLDPIISSGANYSGLQREILAFKKAQISWRSIMRRQQERPNCYFWAQKINTTKWREVLKNNNTIFQQIKKALEKYLDKKREQFQRFFFLSNSELFNIISDAKSPQLTIPFLRKVFDNIFDLEIDSQNFCWAAISQEGERLPFKSCNFKEFDIETMLSQVQESMVSNLKNLMMNALRFYESQERNQWIADYPTQIVFTIENQQFVQILEENYLIDEYQDPEGLEEYGSLEQYAIKLMLDIEDFINFILVEENLVQKIKYQGILTLNIYFRDITNHMYEKNIKKQQDFFWQKTLKIYFKEEFFLSVINSSIPYGYEFCIYFNQVGPYSRLVITPLTERCFLTITTAMMNKLGANPAGPAGTGKTECCKDVAKSVGRLIIVINCSESNDIKMMEKQFSGQVSTGCWLCLDEFNRISIEVLSVIASQLIIIRNCLLEKRTIVNIFGNFINLQRDVGTFITINPGYKQRTVLPESVQLLFRPIAMMIPDFQIVSENLFYSFGFQTATELSKKIGVIFQMCAQQFQTQDHYDFGLRSLKAIIRLSATLKKENPNKSDNFIVFSSLKQSILPKLILKDAEYIIDLLEDIFPRMSKLKLSDETMEPFILKAYEQLNMKFNEYQFKKVLEVYGIMKCYFGSQLVGQSMSGKSTVLNILNHAIQLKHEASPQDNYRVERKTINPKAINLSQLYGNISEITQIWTDGILSNIFRKMSEIDNNLLQQWMVLDGPQDPMWIENLNTVMDDTKILCLGSGERIKLNDTIKIIFEIDDLKSVSPATISRCGITYFEPSNITYKELIDPYFKKFEEKDIQMHKIKQFLDENIEQIDVLLDDLKSPIKQDKICLYQKLFSFFDYFHFATLFGKENSEISPTQMAKVRHNVIYYSLCWGLASHLYENDQLLFVKQLEKIMDIKVQNVNVFDSFLDITERLSGEIVNCKEYIQEYVYDKNIDFYQQIVITPQIVSIKFMTKIFLDLNKHIYITGDVGSGKSVIAEFALNLPDKYSQQNLVYSNTISNADVISKIEFQMTTYKKNKQVHLIPNAFKTLILVIDDINLPDKEIYGAQPPIELLRQIISYDILFDESTQVEKTVEQTLLYAISSHPGGGRQNLSPRFTKCLNLFNIKVMSTQTLSSIYTKQTVQYLQSYAFKSELQQTLPELISSLMDLYERVKQTFLPSFKNPHYNFTTRDVSRVFQGLQLATPMNIENKLSYQLLWYHECTRVFSDKLRTQNEQLKFKRIIDKILEDKFQIKLDPLETIYQLDFLHRDIGVGKKFYEYAKDWNKLSEVITNIMNNDSDLKLIIFKDAVDHILRITRMVLLQNGHLLLIGQEYIGKRSLTKLASIVAKSTYKTIKIGFNYTKKVFKQELLNSIMEASGKGRMVVCYIDDQNYKEDSFLEDISIFLSTKDIYNLASKEEIEKIRLEFENQVKFGEDPYQEFLRRISNQFHLVVGQSPIGTHLQRRLRNLPNLSSLFTIDWYKIWSFDSLKDTATSMLKEDFYLKEPESTKQKISTISAQSYLETNKIYDEFLIKEQRPVYLNPQKYLHFLEQYKKNVLERREFILSQKFKLTKGLDKLQEANLTATQLKQKVLDLQPVLQQKTAQIKELITTLTNDQMQANLVKKTVEQEASDVNTQQEKIMILKNEAEIILKEALPVFEAAAEQLDRLNRSDISEIKNNQNPHPLVKFAIENIAVVFGEKTDWDNIRKVILSDANLLGKLKGINCQKMKKEIKEKIKKRLINNPNFISSEVKNINNAANSLCKWIHAVNNFNEIYKEILTKKDNCVQMDIKLADANQQLQNKQQQLDEVVAQVQLLENKYHATKEEKDKLDWEIKQAEERLSRANQLIDGLQDEASSWTKQLSSLNREVELMFGDSILCLLQMLYCPPITIKYRKVLNATWRSILDEQKQLYSFDVRIDTYLADSQEIQRWVNLGISEDESNLANTIFYLKASQVPIILDSQGISFRFLKKFYADSNVVNFKSYSQNAIKSFQEAFQLGRTVIIEDILGDIPNYIYNYLNQKREIRGDDVYYMIGDKQFQLRSSFRLFITCKEQNPHFLPLVFSMSQVVNFQISKDGLTQELLNVIVQHYLPQDIKVKSELNEQITKDQETVIKSQEKILDRLTNSSGIILDDIELIDSLKISREINLSVNEKIQSSLKKKQELIDIIENYLPVSIRAVSIFFVTQQLQYINIMYKQSLQYFTDALKRFIFSRDIPGDNFEVDIKQTTIDMTYELIKNTISGLFNSDKEIFLFVLAQKFTTENTESEFNIEFQYFYSGFKLKAKHTDLPEGLEIDQEIWNNLVQLRLEINEYIEIIRQINTNGQKWDQFFKSGDILQAESPFPITNLNRILFIKIFQPNSVIHAIKWFIEKELGKEYVDMTGMVGEELLDIMNYMTPLLIIIKPGKDPVHIYRELVSVSGVNTDIVYNLSLGQGQMETAYQNITDAITQGGWLLLQNCHLAPSIFNFIEQKLDHAQEQLQDNQSISDFRLFLTSEVSEDIPINILQKCIKITTEPPSGIKSNLIKNYQKFRDDKQPIKNENIGSISQIIFSLTLLHSVLQERSKFGPIGFTTPYVFIDADLSQSFFIVEQILKANRFIPWEAIQYLLAEIIYGGRITDQQDQTTTRAVVNQFINSKILEKGFQYTDDVEFVSIVQDTQLTQLEYINQLNQRESYKLYGLDDIAEIIYQDITIENSISLIKQIMVSQATDDTSSGFIQKVQEIVDTLKSQLPQLIKIRPKPKNSEITLIDLFMETEIEKFNNLITYLDNLFKQITLCHEGKILVSQEIQTCQTELYEGKTPAIIQKISYPSLKPIHSWMSDFIQRYNFYSNYAYSGQPNVFWISGLYFPQGFLSTIKQQHSRKIKIPLDQINFEFFVQSFLNSDDTLTKPQQGCYINGLHSQGFSFQKRTDKKLFMDPQEPGKFFQEIPIVHFLPVQRDELIKEDKIMVPIYKTTTRKGELTTFGTSNNFILEIQLLSPKKYNQDFWALKGVALFCQLPN